MISPIYLALVVVTVVYTKTDASLPQGGGQQCYQCGREGCALDASPITCPPDRPLCATTASSPNFTSFLSCAADQAKPCSLIYSPKQTLEITCVCPTRLCNAPFSKNMQHELINFSSMITPNVNDTDLVELFLTHSRITNTNDTYEFFQLTTEIGEETELAVANVSQPTMVSTIASVAMKDQWRAAAASVSGPRAQPLRQDTVAPSDDEEDEGEGSGEDADRAPAPAAPDAAADEPAAPRSHLPAAAAPRTLVGLLAAIPAIIHVTL